MYQRIWPCDKDTHHSNTTTADYTAPPRDLTCSSGVDAELAARNASLLDQLSDLCRQAALAARRPLLEWLRLLTQVQIQEPQQEQQRRQYQQWQQEWQGLLWEVVRLRAQLQVGPGGGGVDWRPT